MGKKNRKSSKSGISLAKTKNIKGGKMSSGKKTNSKNVVMARRKLQAAVRKKLHQKKSLDGSKPQEVSMDDVLDMIDDDDLKHLKGKDFKDRQYLVSSETTKGKEQIAGRKRKAVGENDLLESQYENQLANLEDTGKKLKALLPVKTSGGFQSQSIEVDDDDVVIDFSQKKGKGKGKKSEKKPEENSEEEDEKVEQFPFKDSVVSVGKLIAEREEKLLHYRLRIGTLSAGFLEDPQNRTKNLDALLMIMETKDPAVILTIPRLCALSLVSVFQDILPSYPIKHFNPDGVKLKKDTLNLQNQESILLARYTTYLKRLEQQVSAYCPRKKSKLIDSPEYAAGFGEAAMTCMCSMLLSHPYFNLSTNIVNFIVPFLNNWDPKIRSIVFNTIKAIFAKDKRGEISYEIVRRINGLVKINMNTKNVRDIRRDVVDVLLGLRIQKADLEKEKEEESTATNQRTYKQRQMLSKRQKKKAKELVLLEKELLEASAEENKTKKSHFLTEITKLVFTIYFRALKTNPSSNILSAVLEGLSNFAHVINVDFFDDLLAVLERLLSSGNLQQRQVMHCISAVLGVLDGQGAALTLDPTAFHKHLYGALTNLKCGKMESDVYVALNCVSLAMGKRQMPGPRAIAFAKRLATTALQVEHHDAAGILMQLKEIIRLHPSVSTLLDSDGIGGSGVYLPDLEDPDHSCANTSTMWELATLRSHYHPWVAQIARALVVENEKFPVELNKMHAKAICRAFDPSSMEFIPALPEKKQLVSKSRNRNAYFKPRTEYFREELQWEEYLKEDLNTIDSVDFS